MSQYFYRKDDGTEFSLAVDSFSDVWESNDIRALRNDLLNGVQHKACQACWNEEALGKKSKRNRENERWGDQYGTEPKFLDLKLGNTCNLKCRICGPGSSSKWMKESVDVEGHDFIAGIGKKINIVDKSQITRWPEFNQNFWDDVEQWLPKVELFEIYGGEPFLSKQHFDLLRRSIINGYSKNQRIHYNTNGTIFPEDAARDIWPYFKAVDVMLSIDGIGKHFEYMRNPAKWDEVERNIRKFKDAFGDQMMICLTVSMFNVYYLPEYLEYFEKAGIKVWLNILYEPKKFSVNNLPTHAKPVVLDRLQRRAFSSLSEPIDGLLRFIESESVMPFSVFEKDVMAHDKYRSENFASTFAEFASLVGFHDNS